MNKETIEKLLPEITQLFMQDEDFKYLVQRGFKSMAATWWASIPERDKYFTSWLVDVREDASAEYCAEFIKRLMMKIAAVDSAFSKWKDSKTEFTYDGTLDFSIYTCQISKEGIPMILAILTNGVKNFGILATMDISDKIAFKQNSLLDGVIILMGQTVKTKEYMSRPVPVKDFNLKEVQAFIDELSKK